MENNEQEAPLMEPTSEDVREQSTLGETYVPEYEFDNESKPMSRGTKVLMFCGGALALIAGAVFLLPSGEKQPEEPVVAPVEVSIVGAGASFPAPLYQRWTYEYNQLYPNVKIDYQSVGSGAGVQQFINGTVDFGASDVAMKDSEIAQVDRGVKLLPMTAGSIVFAYNVPGVSDLYLTRDVYVDIMLGKITKWNDPRIAEYNPVEALPDMDITVVVRSDGSGTTGVFTKHLSAISEEFASVVGEGKTVEWPVATAAKGNEGITATIMQSEGTIGYIEYGYAALNNIPMATIENKAGEFVAPSTDSAMSTLAQVKLPENLRAFITDPEGDLSYPITSYTWLLVYEDGYDEVTEDALEDFISWALTDGQEFAPELGYIPLPEVVAAKVFDKLIGPTSPVVVE